MADFYFPGSEVRHDLKPFDTPVNPYGAVIRSGREIK